MLTVSTPLKPRGSIFQNGVLSPDYHIKSIQKFVYSMISEWGFNGAYTVCTIRYLPFFLRLQLGNQKFKNCGHTNLALLDHCTHVIDLGHDLQDHVQLRILKKSEMQQRNKVGIRDISNNEFLGSNSQQNTSLYSKLLNSYRTLIFLMLKEFK